MKKIKVSLIVATSKDGFISPKGKEEAPSTKWTSKEDFQFFSKKTKEIGVMLMGSKTFATIGRALPGRLTVVMTRNPEKWRAEYSDANLIFSNDSIEKILEDLEKRGYQELALCGGAAIYNLFLRENLVDKIYMTVEAIEFGDGVKLLENDFLLDKFELLSESKLNEQGTVLREYFFRSSS